MTALLAFGPAPALADDTTHGLQQWSLVTMTARVSDKAMIYLEAQPRTTLAGPPEDRVNHFSSLLLRPAVGYQVHPNLSLWQGYAWTPTFNPELRHEHRLFQQALMQHQIKKVTMVNRTRLEERFIEDARGAAIRGRHMLRLVLPLDADKNWSLVLYDEGFLNFNDVSRGPQAGIDQNRVFAGVNRRLGSQASLEAGYLNQYINRQNAANKVNHALLVWLNFNLP